MSTDEEFGLYLFCECLFSKRVRAEVAHWAAVQHMWWSSLSNAAVDSRLGLRRLIILVVWELWCETIARIFERRGSTVQEVLAKIRGEAAS
ncbi:hypothetical protein BS78_05G077600 [Paspalum vaginatum]|nr:hypothetical protein BS78_05G077600 [Paspalum vaginatum]